MATGDRGGAVNEIRLPSQGVLQGRAQRWTAVAVIVGLLGVAYAATYLAGGTRTVLPHLFYVPVTLAGVLFGLRGGITVALAATILCGPLLPLDVHAGIPQHPVNWVPRGVFFVTIGTLAGGMLFHLRRGYERELSATLHEEMQQVAAPHVPPDPGAGARIRGVLAADALRTVFQPIYALGSGRLLAVEALTRFEVEAPRSPDVWFREAAQVGLGHDLELAAVGRALRTAASLPADVALTLNCGPQLLDAPEFLALLDAHPDREVVVEVTEHVVITDYDRLADAVAVLRARGVRIAVDDAGAGISSLQHIVKLAPDIIKLDISLTQQLHDDPVRRALADCLTRFAREAGCQLIAEGIEQVADLHAWSELGAHAAQGYLLGRPGPLPVASISEHVLAARGVLPLRRHPRVQHA
jgi:EAL domain-containing protein (putative c-di-GMP-specific phosphodiesterase class I)